EAMNACVAANSAPPTATAMSHQASTIEPSASPRPVIRCRIDKADVIWNRFHVGNMNRDSRRCAMRWPGGVGPDAARVAVTSVSFACDFEFEGARVAVGMANDLSSSVSLTVRQVVKATINLSHGI